MRRPCFLLVGVLVICLAACGSNESSMSDMEGLPAVEYSEPSSNPDAEPPFEEEKSNEESEEEAITEQNTFYVSVGGETFSATFADNSGAQALKELLADGDIAIQMSDYGGFEKVGYLGQSLPTSNSQTTTQAGDIVLYQSNQIVIFYGSNSWSYTRLGKIDDLTSWEEALGSGDNSAYRISERPAHIGECLGNWTGQSGVSSPAPPVIQLQRARWLLHLLSKKRRSSEYAEPAALSFWDKGEGGDFHDGCTAERMDLPLVLHYCSVGTDTAVLDIGHGIGFCNLCLRKRGDPWLDGKTAGAERKHPDIIAGKCSGNRFSSLYVWGHPFGRILFKTGYAG